MTSQYNNERSQHRQEQIDRHKKFITNKKTAEIFAVSFDQGKGIEPIKEKFVLAQAELTEAQREHDDYVKKIDAQGKRIDQDKALNIMTRLELAKLAILKRSELEEKIAHHKQHLRSEYVSCKAAQVGQQQLDAAIDYGNKLLQKEALAREAAIQTNKSTLVNLQQATIATDLKQALEQTQKEQGAVSTVQYTVDQATLIALENLGINSNTGLATKFTGDHVQQYIHGQLIESLNRIGSFSQTSPQIKSLLKTAATCNITGQQLNKEHCIEGALWAKEACDRILDLGAAICEGAQEGIISAAQTTIAICQGVANVGGLVGKALGGSEIAQFKIEVAFNRACHAAAQFAQRHARHMILDSLTSGATSIAIGNSIARDLEQPAQQIYAEFLAMSPRDKAKAISKFIVENACFGLIGDAIGQVAKTGYSAVADTVRSLTAAEALFEETVNLTSQALTNEAHVLQAVTEAVQKEVTFLTNVEEVTSFVKNECSNLATGQQSAAQIIAEKSSLKIPSNMAALELLTNVHPEVITLDTLVAAIEKYHPVPGFTGHSDAVLERILGQGDAKVIAHASNTEKAIKAIRGTVFEIETAIKLEAAGEKITEFGAKYYKPGEIIRKGFDPLDFDLATANTLIECKSGNLFSVVNSPTQLEDFIESLLAHKQAAESLSFYRSDKDELSIFMKRFGNYFDLDVDALDGRTILDIARYITIMLDVCEDLVIKNIAYDIDRDNDVFFIHSSTGQALSVALGSPLGSPSNKTYHDYIKAIMKNMQNSTAITPRDMQGNAISAEIFYKGLMREGAAGQELKDYEWRCSWHGYEVMVRLTPYDILTIQPTGTMKMKDADGVPAVDVGFYSRFMLEICKGIGILELKTYF
ncbi:unnamed protein product [Sphagnum balticum]